MSRPLHRGSASLATLINRELAARGLGSPSPPDRYSTPARPRVRRPRLLPAPEPETTPPEPVHPTLPALFGTLTPAEVATLPQEVQAACRGYATVPDWFRDLEPEDLVTNYNRGLFPCVADAEDGEQPWDGAPFPFVGPPDDTLE